VEKEANCLNGEKCRSRDAAGFDVEEQDVEIGPVKAREKEGLQLKI